jgi:hypothetical protein
VCGTGAIGDPFRCCDLSKDTCTINASNNPCRPFRCNTEPTCCVFYFEPCATDDDCGGRPGSCDLGIGFCTDPCAPGVNEHCGSATRICQPFGGSSYKVPNGTVCDDGRSCSHSDSPPGQPLSCANAIGGGNCTRDRSLTDPVDDVGDCALSARICSGSGSTQGGQGGAIVGGKCCAEGTACNLATNTCLGNFGAGASSNDVCLDGTCTADNYVSCPISPGEAAADASMRASRGIGSSVDVTWAPACFSTDHTVYWGTSPIAGGVLNWTASACTLGTSGIGSFDPGTPSPGTFRYFVIVGRDSSFEGPYGTLPFGGQRPEAVGVGSCDRAREIYVCGP